MPPEHQKNLDNAVGAARDNSYLFTVSNTEPDPDYQILFRNLNKGPGPHLIYVAMASCLFMSSFCLFLCPERPQRRLSLVSCHTCAPGARWVQLRSCLQRPWVRTTELRFPQGSQVRVYCVPSEVKAKAAERLLTQVLSRINSQICDDGIFTSC